MTYRIAAIVCWLLIAGCSDDTTLSAKTELLEYRPLSAAELTELVKSTQEEFGLPALGALVWVEGQPPSVAVAGLRKLGSEELVGDSDAWFIGSAAKSMTATLLATYIQDGRVDFDSKLIDIFPEYIDHFRELSRTITVGHLLSHSAGLEPNPAESQDELNQLLAHSTGVTEQRLAVMLDAVSNDLLFEPGSDYKYSNTGYLLAAAVIERIGGKTFDLLLSERVLAPLGITEFGFGHPASINKQNFVDQPWGHRESFFRLVPVAPDDLEHVNPQIFNPAGNLYIDLFGWAIFVRDQLAGREGDGKLLDKMLYERLQIPEDGETGYSYGWGVLAENGVPVMLTHNGSDGSWFADVRAYPATNMFLLVVTNDGREDDEAKAAAAHIRNVFVDRYSPFNRPPIADRPKP